MRKVELLPTRDCEACYGPDVTFDITSILKVGLIGRAPGWPGALKLPGAAV